MKLNYSPGFSTEKLMKLAVWILALIAHIITMRTGIKLFHKSTLSFRKSLVLFFLKLNQTLIITRIFFDEFK